MRKNVINKKKAKRDAIDIGINQEWDETLLESSQRSHARASESRFGSFLVDFHGSELWFLIKEILIGLGERDESSGEIYISRNWPIATLLACDRSFCRLWKPPVFRPNYFSSTPRHFTFTTFAHGFALVCPSRSPFPSSLVLHVARVTRYFQWKPFKPARFISRGQCVPCVPRLSFHLSLASIVANGSPRFCALEGIFKSYHLRDSTRAAPKCTRGVHWRNASVRPHQTSPTDSVSDLLDRSLGTSWFPDTRCKELRAERRGGNVTCLNDRY